MLLVSGWLAHRFARRIDLVRQMFLALEAGRFPRLAPPRTRDELRTLVESANELSSRLETMQSEIHQTERLRLLAQLAGGFAHQLRNAVTGARMAVQLHQRRCSNAEDDSLRIAHAQLKLTEEQVQGLLSLSRTRERPIAANLADILTEARTLVALQADHMRVSLEFNATAGGEFVVVDGQAVRAALLNLLLNAIEAAGIKGRVRLTFATTSEGATIEVADNGPGPPAELAERLFEPFVTGKPEGVGLGLALAREAAALHGGALEWQRTDGWTLFTMRLPAQPPPVDPGRAPALPVAAVPTDDRSDSPGKPPDHGDRAAAHERHPATGTGGLDRPLAGAARRD
jgi:signal transduction histidine kinase